MLFNWSRLHSTFSPTIVLLLLVWITPTVAEPTTYNDPFRALALRAPKPHEHPICCLKPLPSLEPVEDNLLVSFEEWKAKQRHNSENVSAPNLPNNGSNQGRNGSGDGNGSTQVEDTASLLPADSEEQQPAHVQDATVQIPPHFLVPLVDRFDYASLECSARVHKAHKGAKHPSNVLSSKKDRYMLSPCKTNGEKQFIVIELCEDIRIDTVQLANFEFFSGVFKDFTVSVAKTSWKDDSDEGWTVAGTYRAKNVRGVQSFHTPTSLRGFYRYLRIDFHSHYGSEYYCPVSLVRVYGLTHLEEWKWELWEAESRAKMEATAKDAQVPQALEPPHETGLLKETSTVNESSQAVDKEQYISSTQALPISETVHETVPPTTTTTESILHSTDPYLLFSVTAHPSDFEPHRPSPTASSSSVFITSPPISFAPHPSTDPPLNDATVSTPDQHNGTDATSISTTSTPIVVSSASARTSSSSIIVTASPMTTTQSFLPISVSGGESIYRMIVNRLIGLERNHTLYEQYMAQQQLVVREALKRLGEDIGRLEGLGNAQRQVHDRTVAEWEKQRKQWQMQHAMLVQRIDYLTDEIVMEKRLGVAQLCLLLAVLVFMGLTRGSRGPIIEDRRHWRNTLKSLSADWRRPPAMESKDSEASIHGPRTEFPTNAPMRTVPMAISDSLSGQSLASVDDFSSGSTRHPLANIDTNNIHHHHQQKQQSMRDGDENYHPDHSRNSSIVWDNTGTPSRTRSRATSRTRTRTLSWQGRGVLFQSSTSSARQSAVDLRGGQVSRSVAPTSTPSKGSRVMGVYSPRPVIGPIRGNTQASSPRRPGPLQRSHSSHGDPGSIEYVLNQTWIGSGSAHKSARRWARTAHLHEVKGRKKGDESLLGYGGNLNGGNSLGVHSGDSEGGNGDGDSDGDVFGSSGPSQKRKNCSERKYLKSLNDPASTETDGWESTSDIGVDSIEGI